MKRIASLMLVLLTAFSLFGCTAAENPSETAADTVPPETAAPVETTVPAETSAPTETTIPPETAPSEEELAVQEVVTAMLNAHLDNMFLYTDQSFDSCTILSLTEEQASQTVEYKGAQRPISDLLSNIEFLFDKETYWKYVRQDIFRKDFAVTYIFSDFQIDGDAASITATACISFQYVDDNTPSGEQNIFQVDLLWIDSQWLICDVTEQNSWIDGVYKNDPDFDVDALIAELEAAKEG